MRRNNVTKFYSTCKYICMWCGYTYVHNIIENKTFAKYILLHKFPDITERAVI